MSTSSLQAPTIGIIGGGFCGTMVAVHLLRQATTRVHIKLIDRQFALGRGVAYGTPLDAHLLNVPAGKMSAFPDRYLQSHFLDWLHSLPYAAFTFSEPITAQSFVPRKLYGQYLQAILQEAIHQSHPQVTFEHIRAEAKAIQRLAEDIVIQLSPDRLVSVDRVVLALGNFPPADPFGPVLPFHDSHRYIGNPWAPGALQQVDPTQPVLLIGSGLSMVDWAIGLYQQGFSQPIQVISRRGLLPYGHQLPYRPQPSRTPNLPQSEGSNPALEPYKLDPLAIVELEQLRSVRRLMAWIRQTIWQAEQEGYNWRSVIDLLRPHTATIWQTLPLAERRRFLRHVRPYWEIHRHRMAPKINRTLEQLQESGQLQIRAGRIQYYQKQTDGVEVWVRLRQGGLQSLQVGTIVNCTGSECNYRKLRQPLIKQLLQAGLVQPDPLGLGLKVAANGALIQADQRASSWLFTLGAAQKGSLWETTAVPELRQQAVTLAQALWQSLGRENPSCPGTINHSQQNLRKSV
ncbi:MAG: FAD/NAD(P)-binding protein [Elainella sp. Prado103]|jgi:uncharacterized NAD(P)/FAD-binding protein YdhS|nr:FAD/NAD(P)-binding protein [Elainella sp. Prado103]